MFCDINTSTLKQFIKRILYSKYYSRLKFNSFAKSNYTFRLNWRPLLNPSKISLNFTQIVRSTAVHTTICHINFVLIIIVILMMTLASTVGYLVAHIVCIRFGVLRRLSIVIWISAIYSFRNCMVRWWINVT